MKFLFTACVLVMLLAAFVLIPGCATKRYGRLQPVAQLEGASLTCEQIDIELARVQAFEDQVSSGAHVNALSVLAFVNDLGIGNSIERHEAEETAALRRSQLEQLRFEKGCPAR